jgi:hypothetical protein
MCVVKIISGENSGDFKNYGFSGRVQVGKTERIGWFWIPKRQHYLFNKKHTLVGVRRSKGNYWTGSKVRDRIVALYK